MSELRLSALAWAIRDMISVEVTKAGPRSIEVAAERMEHELRGFLRSELERYNVLKVTTLD
jgi:hypothetical protein